MAWSVIGYEGGGFGLDGVNKVEPQRVYPLLYGAAALYESDEDLLLNGVLQAVGMAAGYKNGLAEAQRLEQECALTLFPEPIPVEKPGPYYVVVLALDLAARPPYRIDHPAIYGIVGEWTDPDIGCHVMVFQSENRLAMWKDRLLLGPWEVVARREVPK